MLGVGYGIAGVVDQDLAQPQRVADQVGRHLPVDVEDHFQPFGGGLFGDQAGDIVEHLLQFELGVLDRQLAFLDLRKIKNIVDDAEQMPAGDLDLPDIVALAGRQLGLQGQVGHPDDGIHRGADLVAHVGQEIRFGEVGVFRRRLGVLQLDGPLLQHLIENLALRDVTRGGEHPLQDPVAIVEGGGIQGHHGFLAVPDAHGELIVGDLLVAQHEFDDCLGPLGIGEVFLERRADQFVAGAVGERLHLFVDVGDDTGRVGGHQGVDIGFEQGARVELLVAQALTKLLLFRLDLLAGRVVGADQQITDNGAVLVAQGRHRHHRRKAAAVLPDIGQFVDVLNAARGLEHQGLEARRDRGAEFGAECSGAGDQLLRVGNIGRGDPVQHLVGGIAQHAFRADVEDLDNALGIGGDTREIGAVENRALQGPRLSSASSACLRAVISRRMPVK